MTRIRLRLFMDRHPQVTLVGVALLVAALAYAVAGS